MPDYTPHFGYDPNPIATERFVSRLRFQSVADTPMRAAERDVFLWLPLLSVKPSWHRGAQAIGDCVSWGHELVATMLIAMKAAKQETEWVAEVATESIYGLRAEIDPQNFANYDDGWFGSGAAEALQKYGVCLRLDYSKETGNSEHNLTTYSGNRAKEWGRWGCGGKNDNGKLDEVAKKHPAKDVTRVQSVEQAAAAIDHGCPISICSNVGFEGMQRNSEGIVRRSGSWGHCMMLGGVRYKSGEPQFRIFQSWGKSASGPDPGVEQQAVSDCSWWAVAQDIETILNQDDSFAFTRVEGFAQPPWDWDDSIYVSP